MPRHAGYGPFNHLLTLLSVLQGGASKPKHDYRKGGKATMYEAYARMDHYEPDYIKRCSECEVKFETNDNAQHLCYECEQNRDEEILIVQNILELIDQLRVKADCQDRFVSDLKQVLKELSWE